jgi:hypothetical protein
MLTLNSQELVEASVRLATHPQIGMASAAASIKGLQGQRPPHMGRQVGNHGASHLFWHSGDSNQPLWSSETSTLCVRHTMMSRGFNRSVRRWRMHC